MGTRDPENPRSDKEPVRARRNIEDYDDPYIDDEHYSDLTVCRRCNDVYLSGRWYTPDLLPRDVEVPDYPAEVLCPACRKQRDRVPGGVLRITGDFFWKHEEDILNLIRNESTRAQGDNPLERIMNMHSEGKEVEITTTNEKLAQRIGKALHKAYSGDIEYKWSEDNKLARVYWHREE